MIDIYFLLGLAVPVIIGMMIFKIVALRNEKGSYNNQASNLSTGFIVALRNEKGSYNWG